MTSKALAAAIQTYKRFPKELFRVNAGWRVSLRPKQPEPSTAFFDIITTPRPGLLPPVDQQHQDVEPKALDAENYQGPNGASLRMNTPYTQHYVNRDFKGKNVIVYSVQEGTTLPDDLILVHERPTGEEWSLQPAKRMTLEELNDKITSFLKDNGAMMTRQQWSNAYPKATEPQGAMYPLPKKWKVPNLRTIANRMQQGY